MFRTLTAALIVAAIALAAVPVAGHAAGKTKTLRFFTKPVSFTYTTADGTVTHQPPAGEPQAGDILEIDSIGFRGDHRRHAKRSTMSDHLQCTFAAGGVPDCYSWAAIGGSLLRFHGAELIGGTGRFQGATGRLVKNEEVRGGSDVVARIRLRM